MVRSTIRTLVLLASAGLWSRAATIPVTVQGTTPTQAILSYDSTIDGACTVQVSESSSLTPLVNDVNPVLFSGSNSDQRSGDIVNGRFRTIVIGKRDAEMASDGKHYSRALQAYTQHFFKVTCGSDTGTGTFTTENPPLGNNAPEPPPFDSTAWGNTAWPDINYQDQSVSYIDPQTGILLKRITGPGEGGSAPFDGDFYASTFGSVFDLNSAWDGTAGKILAEDGATANYSGAGTSTDALFLTASTQIAPGYPPQAVEDFLLRLIGTATGTGTDAAMSACLSIDHGQTCATNSVDLPGFPSSPLTEVVGPGILSGQSWNPAPIFFNWISGTMKPPTSEQTATYNGTANASGTQVTWTSGNDFNLDWKPGSYIQITGSGCADHGVAGMCSIASVTDAKHLVLTESSAVVSGAAYTAANFGIRLWKKTTHGSIAIDSAKFDIAVSSGYDSFQNQDPCGSASVVTHVDRNGNALADPAGLSGNLCVFADQFGNNRLFFFSPATGETRHLANLTVPFTPAPPADPKDSHGAGQLCLNISGGSFDPSDPNSVYCSTSTGGSYSVIYKCTYSGDYREWNDEYRAGDNISCVNYTPASQGQDLTSAVTAFDPAIDFSYFNGGIHIDQQSGQTVSLELNQQQNSIGYSITYDLAAKRVIQVRDSWSKYPTRWGGIHGGTGLEGPYSVFFLAPLNAPGSGGVGRYDLQVLSIAGRSDTALPSNYAQDCTSLGVTDPRWIALGATGTNCIQMTVAGEPANTGATAGDIAEFPYPADHRGSHPTWSMLRTKAPGDGVTDVSSQPFGEQFLIAGKTVNPAGTITLVLSRGAYQAQGTLGCATGPQTHSAGWTPMMTFLGACTGNKSWDALTDGLGTNSIVDDPGMNGGHTAYFFNANLMQQVLVGYLYRQGTLPGVLGAPAQYSMNSYTAGFAGSTAGLFFGFIQSHPVMNQLNAPPSEQVWFLDGRPAGGSLGGSSALYNDALSGPVAGTTKVYQITNPSSGFDPKRMPFVGWAGRFLLHEKSGPGVMLTDADTDSFCVAYFAGECATGSSAGNLYVNAHQIDTSSSCLINLNINAPCVNTDTPFFAMFDQVGLSRPDPVGANWRKLGMWFNGPGRTNNFAGLAASRDGTWAFGSCVYCDGIRTDLFAAKLPPWPAYDSENRGGFVNLHVTIGKSNNTAAPNARIRFGYAENGPSGSYFCTARQEACTTGGTPFAYASETQTQTSCTSGCTIDIPAISGRVVYYAVDRLSSSGSLVTSGSTQALAAP